MVRVIHIFMDIRFFILFLNISTQIRVVGAQKENIPTVFFTHSHVRCIFNFIYMYCEYGRSTTAKKQSTRWPISSSTIYQYRYRFHYHHYFIKNTDAIFFAVVKMSYDISHDEKYDKKWLKLMLWYGTMKRKKRYSTQTTATRTNDSESYTQT